eukprot:ANDGO_07503.mRNA.1 hypothetical protein
MKDHSEAYDAFKSLKVQLVNFGTEIQTISVPLSNPHFRPAFRNIWDLKTLLKYILKRPTMLCDAFDDKCKKMTDAQIPEESICLVARVPQKITTSELVPQIANQLNVHCSIVTSRVSTEDMHPGTPVVANVSEGSDDSESDVDDTAEEEGSSATTSLKHHFSRLCWGAKFTNGGNCEFRLFAVVHNRQQFVRLHHPARCGIEIAQYVPKQPRPDCSRKQKKFSMISDVSLNFVDGEPLDYGPLHISHFQALRMESSPCQGFQEATLSGLDDYVLCPTLNSFDNALRTWMGLISPADKRLLHFWNHNKRRLLLPDSILLEWRPVNGNLGNDIDRREQQQLIMVVWQQQRDYPLDPPSGTIRGECGSYLICPVDWCGLPGGPKTKAILGFLCVGNTERRLSGFVPAWHLKDQLDVMISQNFP